MGSSCVINTFFCQNQHYAFACASYLLKTDTVRTLRDKKRPCASSSNLHELSMIKKFSVKPEMLIFFFQKTEKSFPHFAKCGNGIT